MAYLAAKLKKLIFKPLQGLSVNFDLHRAGLKFILKYEKLHNVGAMEPINIWNCKVVETRKNIYINNTCNLVPNKNVHMILFQNYAHVCATQQSHHSSQVLHTTLLVDSSEPK